MPLVWIIHIKKIKWENKQNPRKSIRIVYGQRKTSCSELLNMDKSVSKHKETCSVYLLKSTKLKRTSRQ